MTELNIAKFSDEQLDFGHFGKHSGASLGCLRALFSVTGSGFQVSPGKICGTQNPLFIMIILKVYKCV